MCDMCKAYSNIRRKAGEAAKHEKWGSQMLKLVLRGALVYPTVSAECCNMRKGLTHLCSQLAGDVLLEAKSTNSKVNSEPLPGRVCGMDLSQAHLCPPHL